MPRRWAFTGLLLYPLKETLREYLSRPSVFWGQILVSSVLAAQRKQNYPLRPQTTSDRAYFLASLRNGSVDSKVFRALPGKERGGWRPPPSASRSLLQFLPSLSTWHTTGTFDKGCFVLELSCGRSVTQIDKPPTGCSFLLWREHDPRRKEWIIVKRLFLYLIQNLRLFVNSFKKVTSRQMNQSSARIRSRCFGNSHCWAGRLSLPLPSPIPRTGLWWQRWNFAGWAYQVSTCSRIKWLWKKGLPTLNPNDLVSDGVRTVSQCQVCLWRSPGSTEGRSSRASRSTETQHEAGIPKSTASLAQRAWATIKT